MLLHISWHSTACSTHSPFTLQTADTPNHVVRATNSGQTCLHFCARSTAYTKPRAHTQPFTCNTIPRKDTMIPYMAQSRYPLNSSVLAIFFPFATIPATPHHPVSTDRYSLLYGTLTFLLHFMTNTFFSTFLPLYSLPFASTSLLIHTAGPILCTPPSLTPLTKF